MRKKLLIVLSILSFIIVPNVKAACSYKEQADLNKEASYVKVGYEIVTEEMKVSMPETEESTTIQYEIFRVNILNLTENFYVTVTNNVNKDNKKYYFSNSVNGVISFNWDDLDKVTTMTFKVYSSSQTNCKDELYRTIYLTLPRYNSYSSTSLCKDSKSSVCEKFVTFDKITYDEFMTRYSKSESEQASNGTNTNNNGVINGESIARNNTYLYIGLGAVAVILVIAAVVRSKKRKSL